jgi:hypothetical protein
MLKPETIKTLEDYGFDTLEDYLQDLSEQYGVPEDVIYSLYDVLGEFELFDGLVSAIQDAENMFDDEWDSEE